MKSSKTRWVVVAILFVFMLLHQTDKLLINSLGTQIKGEWHLTDTQWGLIATGALIVGSIFYPIWGYLYDRYARSKLLALASFIWGATTWISAIAPSYHTFLASRASTGIDDSSYPGIYSLIADYFSPEMRGKIYGLLQLTQPIGFLIGMILGLMVADAFGWRNLFYVTGALGILLSVVIFFGVKDVSRGQSEPEMQKLEGITNYRFEWSKVKDVLKLPSLWFMYLQGFFGVFPWNTITAFIILYLAEERGYDGGTTMLILAPTIIVMAIGYPFGGAVGDYFFKKSPRGRLLTAMVGVLLGAILLAITLNVPYDQPLTFALLMGLAALFIPVASPNVTSTVNDVTLPEIRSTAMSIQYFIESSGAALAPTIAGVISDSLRAASNPSPIGTSILIICTSTWILCAFFFYFASRIITKDIHQLREFMQIRAKDEIAHIKAN